MNIIKWSIVWLILLIGCIIMLFGCTATETVCNTHLGASQKEDTVYIEMHNWRHSGVYTEYDTIIGADMMYYFKQSLLKNTLSY